METPKDPASAKGEVKHVKRSKIFSSLGASDDGEEKNEEKSNLTQSTSLPNEEYRREDLSRSNGEEDGEKGEFKNDATKLEPMFQRSRFARVRTRFPVPVILWNNKNVSCQFHLHFFPGNYR